MKFLPPDIYWKQVGAKDKVGKYLHAEEVKLSKQFQSEDRQRSFLMGRAAAKQALSEAGADGAAPLLRTDFGAAKWPRGYTGSISHSGGRAIAAVAKTDNYLSIGIDIENLRDTRTGLIKRIATENEKTWILDDKTKLIQIFSAKEAIYKVLAPLSDTTPGFRDVNLDFAEDGSFFKVSAIGGRALAHTKLINSLKVFSTATENFVISCTWVAKDQI